jgi:hypothetical protein
MIVLKIDVTKIDKNHLFVGKSGKYLDCILNENRDGPDQYGNIGFIAQSVSKEAKEKGERGPIIGNYKEIVTTPRVPKQTESKPATKSKPATDDAGSGLPF